jgi:hypothetical protein
VITNWRSCLVALELLQGVGVISRRRSDPEVSEWPLAFASLTMLPFFCKIYVVTGVLLLFLHEILQILMKVGCLIDQI